MPADLVRLLARYALLAVGAVLLNFFIPRWLPGNPLTFSSGEGTDAAVPLSAEARDQLQAYYHLDQPARRQLILYLGDVVRGDFGSSIARPAPVSDLILDRLPWTLALLLSSLLLSALVGTAIGMAAGWLPDRARDRLLVSTASGCAAIPEFLIAIGLLLTFSVGLDWFPLFGGQRVFATYGDGVQGIVSHGLDIARHLALPVATLVVAGLSSFLLVARDTTAGLRHQAWLIAARAKGLSEPQVARRHALPNITLPLVTFFGLRLGSVLGGALVVERVFGVPGLGLLGYQAIRGRDYPVLQALFLIASLGVLLANLAVDLLSLRLEQRRGLGGA